MNGATFFALIVLGGLISADSICSGEVIDYSVNPHPADNFLEASFRFVIPDAGSQPSAILVFIPGTDGDGRGVATDATFLSISKACHAALVGCDFRGEGLGYDDPSGGSGRALDEAISHFAASTHNPQLAQAPLLLIGYSQGGMFAFNYVCWRPERLKAFAALKAVFPKFQPKPASFCVPGLLVAGQTDEVGRIQAIAKAFESATGKHSRWAFLFEKGIGHELDAKSIGLADLLFEAVCAEAPTDVPLFLNAETKAPEHADSIAAGLCWFANQEMADTWALLDKPVPLQELVSMPERPKLQDLLTIKCDPDEYNSENGDQREGIIELSGNMPGITINYTQIGGEGFTIKGSSQGPLPVRLAVCFSPRGLPWGRLRGDINIGGALNGQSLEPLSLSVSGVVKGPVTAFPAMAYLGAASRGSTINQKIHLRCTQGAMHITNIEAPKEMTVALEAETESDSELNIHWIPGNRLGKVSGDILLSFDVPEKGILRIPVLGVVSR